MDSSEDRPPKSRSKDHNFLMDDTSFQFDSAWEDYNQLNMALQQGHKKRVKLLIQIGARVNRNSAFYPASSPLHLAVNLGCPKIVKMLLDKGADINIKNNNDETPLIMATKMRKDHITDLLLSVVSIKNCTNKENLSHLHIACIKNKVEIVKKLAQHGASINAAVNSKSLHWPGYTPLHFAVQFQSIETVKYLINCGSDITAMNSQQLTPLHLADTLRNETIIDLILSVHKYEITNPTNSEGLSHFHIACTRNDPTVVESFIKQGVDINIKVLQSSLNWTLYRPIIFAIDYECTEVVKLLLLYNANLKMDFDDLNAIHCANKTANKTIIDLVLSKSIIRNTNTKGIIELSNNLVIKPMDINLPIWISNSIPLHLAIKQNHITMIREKLLSNNGAEFIIKDARGKTPLHFAFEMKQLDIVDLILSAHLEIKENPTDNNGLSHFHISCTRNNTKVIKRILQNRVDINSFVNTDSAFWPGYTALHFAAKFKQHTVVKLLLQQGADITAKNKFGLTALDIAIIKSANFMKSNIDETFIIIDSILSAADLRNDDSLDRRGFSRLHIFVINNDRNSIEKLLNSHPETIDKPVNWAASKWSGFTSLHFAAYFSSKATFKLLLKRGANISIKNAKGDTPVHTCFMETSNFLKFTKENPIGSAGVSHFQIACSCGHYKAAQRFLSLGTIDVNQPTMFTGLYTRAGLTPLQLAIRNVEVNEELVQLLLKQGADVHARDAELNTPLHHTDENSSTWAARMLLSLGANVDARNAYDETPLHLFCYYHEREDFKILPEKVRLLLEWGADINAEDERGETPFTRTDWVKKFHIHDRKFFDLMMKHIKKLKVIGQPVSAKNEQAYAKLLAKYHQVENKNRGKKKSRDKNLHRDYYEATEFAKECWKELKRMTELRIDPYTTLRDVLSKEQDEMALHSENADFREMVQAPNFDLRFPVYGFLVRLQLERGLEKRLLLEESKVSLNRLTKLTWPDPCTENILKNLNNKELRSVIDSDLTEGATRL